MRAVIIVQNADDMCLIYDILTMFVHQHPDRTVTYILDIIAWYGWTSLHFPVALKDIRIFERKILMSYMFISVNVNGMKHAMVGRGSNGTPEFKPKVYPLKTCK